MHELTESKALQWHEIAELLRALGYIDASSEARAVQPARAAGKSNDGGHHFRYTRRAVSRHAASAKEQIVRGMATEP